MPSLTVCVSPPDDEEHLPDETVSLSDRYDMLEQEKLTVLPSAAFTDNRITHKELLFKYVTSYESHSFAHALNAE
ncbi:unnamed protein product [Sphagnum tenellum]